MRMCSNRYLPYNRTDLQQFYRLIQSIIDHLGQDLSPNGTGIIKRACLVQQASIGSRMKFEEFLSHMTWCRACGRKFASANVQCNKKAFEKKENHQGYPNLSERIPLRLSLERRFPILF